MRREATEAQPDISVENLEESFGVAQHRQSRTKLSTEFNTIVLPHLNPDLNIEENTLPADNKFQTDSQTKLVRETIKIIE